MSIITDIDREHCNDTSSVRHQHREASVNSNCIEKCHVVADDEKSIVILAQHGLRCFDRPNV